MLHLLLLLLRRAEMSHRDQESAAARMGASRPVGERRRLQSAAAKGEERADVKR